MNLSSLPINSIKKDIAYWYDKIIVQTSYNERDFIKPEHDGSFNYFIPQVATLYLFEYREYLKKRIEKGVKQIGQKNSKNQVQKEITFLELFKWNEERVDKFIKLLKTPKINAIDENYRWIYNIRKSSIVACFEALEELNIIKKGIPKSVLRRTVSTKIKFDGNEKLFRNPTNPRDYDEFYRLFQHQLE